MIWCMKVWKLVSQGYRSTAIVEIQIQLTFVLCLRNPPLYIFLTHRITELTWHISYIPALFMFYKHEFNYNTPAANLKMYNTQN